MREKIGKLEIALWFIVLIILITVGLIDYKYFTQEYDFIFAILYNLTAGALAALILVFFQRKDYNNQISTRYKQIADIYVREFIKEPASEHNEELQKKHQGKEIVLTHLQGHLIKIETEYWDYKVIGVIEFNENNPFVGNGPYRYINNPKLDVGIYKIHRFPDEPNILYVFYENTIPKNGAIGYEVWKRKYPPVGRRFEQGRKVKATLPAKDSLS